MNFRLFLFGTSVEHTITDGSGTGLMTLVISVNQDNTFRRIKLNQ